MKIKYSTMIVKDMDKSVNFYTDKLGFKIDSKYDLPQGRITLLKGEGDTMIELIENESYDVGLYSIGMDVEDMDYEVKKLKDEGIKFDMEPIEITIGSMALFKDPNWVNIVLVHHD
jgi:lactoylglutathione lyase